MGAWRNNKPTTWATSSGEVSGTYSGHWTGLVAFYARDDSPSPTTIYTQKSGVPDLTITGGVTAQDDCLRFNGSTGYARCDRDADLETPSAAITVAMAFALLADPSDEAWYAGRYDGNTGANVYGFCSRQWNTNRDIDFRFYQDGVGYIDTQKQTAVTSLSTDYIAVGRWASGETASCALYLASSGALVDSSTSSGTVTGTIGYPNTSAGSGFEIGRRASGTPIWVNMDCGGVAVWSRKLSDTEVTDLVTDFYGPVRAVATGPVNPWRNVTTATKTARYAALW